MEIGCWSILVSVIGIMATGGLAWYIYKRATSMTKEMKEFLITLIVNSAPDPKILEKLLQDHGNTGKWRGIVEPDPARMGYSRIAWHAQFITPMGIVSTAAVGKPTIIQSPPKPSKKEPIE